MLLIFSIHQNTTFFWASSF